MIGKCTYLLAFLLAIFALQSCKSKKQKTNWAITLSKDDKMPYGSYIAYQSLKYYFPAAETEAISPWFRYNNITDKMKYGNTSLFILAGLNLYLSDEETEKLLEYAAAGNEVLIFASNIDEKLERKFQFNKIPYSTRRAYEEIPLNNYNNGTENEDVLKLKDEDGKKYGYTGRYIGGYFLKKEHKDDEAEEEPKEDNSVYIDSMADTLGTIDGRPDILRYKVGEGHVTLHAAPLVLSNYFLLQSDNRNYLAAIWHSLPGDISHIYWNEYYKRSTEGSNFGVLWRYPPTRNALLLAILALILYILFEGKRRQRILPVVAPLENSSVSFVETIGRLYYNKGDHNNLADKMIQHFLEWVRNHYYLNTNYLNEDFIKQLTNKSGQPEAAVRNIVEMIHEIRMGKQVDEAYLYQLYNNIEQFYKNKA